MSCILWFTYLKGSTFNVKYLLLWWNKKSIFFGYEVRKVNYCISDDRQLFEIYDSLPNASLDKMNDVIRAAVNLCTAFYICVGFFGYVAFCTQNFTGNYNSVDMTSNEVFEWSRYLHHNKVADNRITNLSSTFKQDFLLCLTGMFVTPHDCNSYSLRLDTGWYFPWILNL